MDAQLKRGLLDACVLSSLLREDSYGYEIIHKLSGKVDISESTLYPILRRLEGADLVSEYSMEHGGRLRKYYSITEDGRLRIERFLDEWAQVMEIYRFIKGEVAVHDKG